MLDKRQSAVIIFVRGPFRVETLDGHDLSPTSRKSRAIFALLAMSPNVSRTRAWLQDKLWSDRGPEQGAASLRQCLSEIRRTLGSMRDVLGADRQSVWLVRDSVQIIDEPSDLELDYFEGLDVRDPEFDHWLTKLRANGRIEERSAKNPIHAPALRKIKKRVSVQLIVNLHSMRNSAMGFAEVALIDLVSKNIREQTEIELYFEPPELVRPGALVLEVQCHAMRTDGLLYQVSVTKASDSQVLWSGTHAVPHLPGYEDTPTELYAASTVVANGVLEAMSKPDMSLISDADLDANVLALMGMQKIFVLRPEDASQAEELLSSAFESKGRGVYLAWLAQLNTIEFIEGFRSRDDAAEAARERVAKAMELEPGNSQVLTVAANCSMVFDRNAPLAGQWAQMAVRANPSNAMAWWVLAHMQLYNGDYETSYVTSQRGQSLAAGTGLQYWMAFQSAIAAAFSGKQEEASVLCGLSSALRPEFRAALRFAVTLHAAADEKDLAALAIRRLQTLECDFALERFVHDPDYPARLLRDMPLYAPDKILRLET